MTQLNDEHLKDAALSRLRSHINRKQISPREVLDTLDLIYGSSSNNEVVKVAKKMLLSALLKFRSAICVSALYPELQNLFNKYPALRFDDAMATSYKELCLEAGEG